MSVGARRMSFTFRKNSWDQTRQGERHSDWRGKKKTTGKDIQKVSRICIAVYTHIHELLVLDRRLHGVGGVIQSVLPGVHEEGQAQLPCCRTTETQDTTSNYVLASHCHLMLSDVSRRRNCFNICC